MNAYPFDHGYAVQLANALETSAQRLESPWRERLEPNIAQIAQILRQEDIFVHNTADYFIRTAHSIAALLEKVHAGTFYADDSDCDCNEQDEQDDEDDEKNKEHNEPCSA